MSESKQIILTELEAELLTRSMRGWRAAAERRAEMLRQAEAMMHDVEEDERRLVALICETHDTLPPDDWRIVTDDQGRARAIQPRAPAGTQDGTTSEGSATVATQVRE